jgi:hypothetical protein
MIDFIIALWLSCAAASALYIILIMKASQLKISEEVQNNNLQIKQEIILTKGFLFLSFVIVFFVAMLSGPYAIYKLSFYNESITKKIHNLVLETAQKDSK